MSRSLTHELVRHRHFSFSQRSQRFVDEGAEPIFVVPYAFRAGVEYCQKASPLDFHCVEFGVGAVWLATVEDAHDAYVVAVADQFKILCGGADLESFSIEERTTIRKKARESARSLLPNATETKIGVTMNARSARNFLELRGSRHADVEIRILANKVYEALLADSPSLFNDYAKMDLPDGTFELTTPFRKI